MPFYPTIFSQQFFTMLIYRNVFCTKVVHLPTMWFYRNILSQNLFTYLPCCFIVTFCHKICSPTYHAVLSLYVVTKFVQLPTMLFYRNILSQNLFTYLPCCFNGTTPTHTMLFYRNILSQNLFSCLPWCFIVIFCHKICSPTYHAVLS